MYGICTGTFNIKAFLGLKIRRGGASGGRGRRRIERMGRKKKQENTNSEKEDVTKMKNVQGSSRRDLEDQYQVLSILQAYDKV